MDKTEDIKIDFDENPEGLVIQKTQYIDPAYIDSLKDHRFETNSRPSGEYMRVASIPVIIIEKWQREGFDFWNAPAREIVAKLKMEGLDYFLTTDKQI